MGRGRGEHQQDRKGALKGKGGEGIQQTPGPGVGSLCDQLKIQTKQLYVRNTAQTAMWA